MREKIGFSCIFCNGSFLIVDFTSMMPHGCRPRPNFVKYGVFLLDCVIFYLVRSRLSISRHVDHRWDLNP